MKKSSSALASLAVVAGITGGAALTAQAHPAQAPDQTAARHTSGVALTRLHALLQTPSAAADRVIRPTEGGSPHF